MVVRRQCSGLVLSFHPEVPRTEQVIRLGNKHFHTVSHLPSHLPLLQLLLFFLQDSFSLCSSSRPGTHSLDQAGLKFRDLPASASQVLGLKACATSASSFLIHHSPMTLMMLLYAFTFSNYSSSVCFLAI